MEYRFFTYIFVKGKHKTCRDVSDLKFKKNVGKHCKSLTWKNVLLLPISCTDFNNVGVSQKSSKIAQKNVGKTLKLNPKCDYQSIILCL